MRVGVSCGLAITLLAASFANAEAPSGISAPANGDANPTKFRQALLIANSHYAEIGLDRQGGKGLSALAEQLGDAAFDVAARQNLGHAALAEALRELASRLRPGAPVFLYFSGLATSINGHVFLLPVDGKVADEADVRAQGVDVDAALMDLRQHGAGPAIVVLEVPRDNPIERRFRAKELGLGFIRAPRNTLVLSDSEPAATSDEVSPLLDELLKELRTPGASFEEALFRTRLGVVRATGGAEVPRFASSLATALDVTPAEVEFVEAPSAPHTTPPKPPKESPAEKPAPNEKASAQPNEMKQPAQSHPTPPPASVPSTNATQAQQTHVAEPVRNTPPVQVPNEPGATFQDCAECPKLAIVPAGSFVMGAAPGEGPPHRVILGRFFSLGRSEVTTGEWARCVADGACARRLDEARADQPARVAWNDAQDYARWLSRRTGKTYRLPTEAEWVYAAHGGQSTVPMARPMTGAAAPNGFGLVGMSGEPAEWTQDCWNSNFWGAPHDGSAWLKGDCALRVVRSGPEGIGRRVSLRVSDRGALAGLRVLREIP